MPFVEEGIIYDTGSLDGTRELLEEMQGKYPNLKVFDTEFRGYANSRDETVRKAQTKYALILDADERITQKDFGFIKEGMREVPRVGYNLHIHNVYPNGSVGSIMGHNPRIFDRTQGFEFNCRVWEHLFDKKENKVADLDSVKYIKNVELLHFVPGEKAREQKREDWYSQIGGFKDVFTKEDYDKISAPSQTSSFKRWKRKSPARHKYTFGVQAA